MTQFLISLSKKCLAVVALLLLSIAIAGVAPSNVSQAFFEAGQRDYWPPTIDGYSAQFIGSSIKFAPAFYNLGEGINPQITVTNPGGEKTQTIYLYVSKVIESPKGRNIEDGTPNGPDITDGELNANEQADNDVQTFPEIHNVGTFTFPAGGQQVISFTFTPATPGYYQFDYSTLPPGNGYVEGHILAAGFVRVLPQRQDPTPSPSASPVATPQPTPTINPSPTPASGKHTHVAIENLSCPNTTFDVVTRVTENGNPVKNTKVKFSFNSNVQEAWTNDDGRAKVTYSASSNGTLVVEPENYPSQTLLINVPTNCGVGGTTSVSNNSSSTPSILGATTLAATGSTASYQALSILAFGMIVAGASAYGYYQVQKKV